MTLQGHRTNPQSSIVSLRRFRRCALRRGFAFRSFRDKRVCNLVKQLVIDALSSLIFQSLFYRRKVCWTLVRN